MTKNNSSSKPQPRHPSTGRNIPRAGSTRIIREARQFEAALRQQDAHRKKPGRISPGGVIIPN